MLIFKLALRNLLRGRLRTVLNVLVLSFSFVIVIWHQGLLQGMNQQISRSMIDADIAGGQYWHQEYDPYDPLTLDDSHGRIPPALDHLVQQKSIQPMLLRQATIYPRGNVMMVTLRGIDPEQEVLKLPLLQLKSKATLPLMIGQQMSKRSGLQIGDTITIRLKDKNGRFDAVDGQIVGLFKTDVSSVDQNQVWMSLKNLQNLTGLNGEATILIIGKNLSTQTKIENWVLKTSDDLLADVTKLIAQKQGTSKILWFLLIFLAMLAIFDTQVLAVFKRQKEIGTMIALGFTRKKVVFLFTLEGFFNGVLAALVGAIYGIPLLVFFATKGFAIYSSAQDFGMAIPERIYGAYSAQLVLGTSLVIFVAVTIVSYLPVRKIAKLNPTDAIRGRQS